MPRRTPASSPHDPATAALLQTLTPHGGTFQYESGPSTATNDRWALSYDVLYLTGSFSTTSDYLQMLAPLANSYTADRRGWARPSEAFLYLGQIPYALALLGLVAGRGRLRRRAT